MNGSDSPIPAAAVLAAGGPVARSLGDAFEPRPEQAAMAEAVGRTLRDRAHLLVEAGTGVGKSFAYLVPVILRCLRFGERVVVATHTISLQEQLLNKDLPLLRRAMELDDAGSGCGEEKLGSDGTPDSGGSLVSLTMNGVDEDRRGASVHPGTGEETRRGASVHPREPRPTLRPVLVKGRGNYLSIRRLKLASSRQDRLLSDAASRRSLHAIEDWAYSTTDGTLSTRPAIERGGVWSHVESDAGNCMGRKCPHHGECFYQADRRRMEQANLLICNHALFFSDLALRAGDAGFLPPYDHVILDEAHQVEDVASEHFGVSLAEGRVEHLLSTLYSRRGGKGYLPHLAVAAGDASAVDRVIRLVLEAEASGRAFFESWLHVAGRPGASRRVRRAGEVADVLSPAMRELVLGLKALRENVKNEPDRFELNAYAERAAAAADAAAVLVNQTLDGCVYWVETGQASAGRPPRVRLSCSPIDVAPILRQHLFSGKFSVVMTSATLATKSGGAPKSGRATNSGVAGGMVASRATEIGSAISVPGGHDDDGRAKPEPRVVEIDEEGRVVGDEPPTDEEGMLGLGRSDERPTRSVGPPEAGQASNTALQASNTSAAGPFSHILSRLGCEGAGALALGSPFDYASQVTLFAARSLPAPPPGRLPPQYLAQLAEHVLRHLAQTDGGAFILFNSFSSLRSVADVLRGPLAARGMPMLVHDPESPRGELLKQFRADPRSVLLGAASFWQGVDIRGDGLRCIIIHQLPFEPPDRPLTEARLERLRSQGRNPFLEDSLPRAVIRFKQGFGRLIRSRTDHGRVVVLDPRLVTKPYGRTFLAALPEGVPVVEE